MQIYMRHSTRLYNIGPLAHCIAYHIWRISLSIEVKQPCIHGRCPISMVTIDCINKAMHRKAILGGEFHLYVSNAAKPYHETIDEIIFMMQGFIFEVSYVLAFNYKTHNDLEQCRHDFIQMKLFPSLLYLNLYHVILIAYVTPYLMYMEHHETFHWN